MTWKTVLVSALIVLASCSHQKTSTLPSVKDWIRQSDEIANKYSRERGSLSPEMASYLGFSEFDTEVTGLDSTYEERILSFEKKWLAKLESESKKSHPPETLEDIAILKEKVKLTIEGTELDKKLAVMTFNAGTKDIFQGLQAMINPQIPKDRQAKAVDRFKKYVNGFGKYKPFLVACAEHMKEQAKEFAGKNPVYPYKREVDLYLSESPTYTAGIEELLKSTGRTDWQADYEKFKSQAVVFDAFVKSDILPYARTKAQLPRDLYAFNLKAMGFQVSPEELIEIGEAGYKELYPRYQALAKNLAKKYHLQSSQPKDVMAFLKKKQVTKHDEVEKLYHEADARLKDIIIKNRIATLPAQPLVIRLAGEAESKAAPVPHLNPPPFVNNKGERPEFVVPTAKGKMPYDDFTHQYAAIMLTAHEGRPGHDLQFSRMLEGGMSMIRATYAMNSVNVEGWALYAEDMVYPYVKDEEKFVGLQMRLWRMARAFLDPQIQLGKIKDQRVFDVFTKELGVSKEMAELELRRYSIMAPGQAPSYYYGYLMVKKTREWAEARAGQNFDPKCFNDQVLSYGLLPLPMIFDKVKNSPACLALD
ncbi:DUF885 domain-containing protein [Bdellovibrio svalbardensis]|uniref:DUF885 domain-containing protein n=1 Tax=Bdellovibrio svalbardensis TaxID=2972972 RepID=A0ABT6DFU2_9BACT|nr:DUF885 domain-containing protein [Bdellovibrio svalbardensis]MDG0814726.1 DUF885 domain-containing protein [Bdellovibrio svalbardensis]